MMTALDTVETIPIVLGADGVIRVGGTRVTLDVLIAAFREGATPRGNRAPVSVSCAGRHLRGDRLCLTSPRHCGKLFDSAFRRGNECPHRKRAKMFYGRHSGKVVVAATE